MHVFLHCIALERTNTVGHKHRRPEKNNACKKFIMEKRRQRATKTQAGMELDNRVKEHIWMREI